MSHDLKPVQVRLPPDVYESLRMIADANDHDLGEEAREILTEALLGKGHILKILAKRLAGAVRTVNDREGALTMRWIRLWVDESINGTTFTELNAEHRGVWYTLLLLAAYSPKPGTICIADGVAYTREQLAAFTKLVLEVLNRGIEHLSAPGVEKITINTD